MDSKELREKFIKFFENKEHQHLMPVGLVPTDQSVLFTTAGMQPLVPYLMGEKHPEGNKLVNIQRCIRTDDIDEVGDETHLTFFEMMGFWSLGDYWKKEAINYTYDFFTKELNIDPKKLAITCFEGDKKNGIEKDTESAEIWQNLGIPENRIAFLGYKDNFWGPTSAEGPCGPDTEIFVWTREDEVPEKYDPKDSKWVEIGNDVFMQYNKNADGKFEPLAQKNVDFGAGFERIIAYLEKKNNIFETELFEPIIKKIEEISHQKYQENQKQFRIIADHIKAAVFAINDDILPLNKDRGYIVRRLIRRAIVKASQLGISQNFINDIATEVFKTYDGVYQFDQEMISQELEKEETRFRNTLKNGLRMLNSHKEIDGKILFNLYQSFGIPMEIAVEEAKEKNIEIIKNAEEKFNNELKKHQNLSRTASAGMFKGGLAGGGEQETKYHTATHLLLASLRQVLGNNIVQKGSNITAERLRFDFNWPEKLTDDQMKKIENWINDKINQNLLVEIKEMVLSEALKSDVTSIPGFQYPDKVKVYSIGDISREICGGPHVKSTGQLGHFKIIKEESSSAGIRRIKAVLQ